MEDYAAYDEQVINDRKYGRSQNDDDDDDDDDVQKNVQENVQENEQCRNGVCTKIGKFFGVEYRGGRKTNKRRINKINKRRTIKRRINKRKTNKRRINKRKTNKRKQ